MIIIKYFLNQWGEKNAYSIKKKKKTKTKCPLYPAKVRSFFFRKVFGWKERAVTQAQLSLGVWVVHG